MAVTPPTLTTLFVTAVKYDVDEHNLADWLKKEFGNDATHEVCAFMLSSN